MKLTNWIAFSALCRVKFVCDPNISGWTSRNNTMLEVMNAQNC